MLHVRGVFGQNRHQREDERQFAVGRAGQIIAHRQRVRRVDRFDQAEGDALLRSAFGFQKIEGKQHIRRGERGAVGEMRARIEMEGHMLAVRVEVDGARDLPVKREGLVLRAGHQCLEDVADQPLRGRARLDVERI